MPVSNSPQSSPAGPLRTPLYEMHTVMGAKMGKFAGYEMPLWYPTKIIAEHLHTRQSASLFDISHMGQAFVGGSDAAAILERLTPSDLVALPDGAMRYCCLTGENGGILDDLIASKFLGRYYVVVNAARKQHDLTHMEHHCAEGQVERLENRALLALQGPASAEAVKHFAPAAPAQKFMTICEYDIDGSAFYVSRSGYSGEDGFEISLPNDSADAFAWEMLKRPGVKLAGLGARDSLRMEAGLRLYGQDMTEETTPVDAGIGWTVSKSRRPGGARAGGFYGADAIFDQLAAGASRRFAGLRLQTNVPARTGVPVASLDGDEIGIVTSGGFAPSVNAPIAMGYVDRGHMKPGARVNLIIRGKPQPATLERLPFVTHQYAT